jgi:hypothetical protein
MATIAPNDFLKALCNGAHPRKQQSLQLIYRLCEEQHDRGSSDFSIATIGRLSAAVGGPSAAAIRNKTGDDYKALIKIYAEAVGGKAKKVPARKGSILDEILEGVSDPVLRTRIGILLAELESARGQVTALRHLAGQRAVLHMGPTETVSTDAVVPCAIDLSKQERNALERAIAPATLQHWGWVAEANGRVKTDAGQVVYPAGYLTAIQKVLGP